jgi:hypothetical protein
MIWHVVIIIGLVIIGLYVAAGIITMIVAWALMIVADRRRRSIK